MSLTIWWYWRSRVGAQYWIKKVIKLRNWQEAHKTCLHTTSHRMNNKVWVRPHYIQHNSSSSDTVWYTVFWWLHCDQYVAVHSCCLCHCEENQRLHVGLVTEDNRLSGDEEYFSFLFQEHFEIELFSSQKLLKKQYLYLMVFVTTVFDTKCYNNKIRQFFNI